MAATMEAAASAVNDEWATTTPSRGASSAHRDDIPLELMTWPELKRIAREFDLSLNVKKPELIRKIRAARVAAVREAKYRKSFVGKVHLATASAYRRWSRLRAAKANVRARNVNFKRKAKAAAKSARGRAVGHADAPREQVAKAPAELSPLVLWTGCMLLGGAAVLILTLLV